MPLHRAQGPGSQSAPREHARDRRERSRQRARAHREHTGNAATHAETRKPRETMSYSDDEEDVYEYSEDDEDADDGA